MYWQLSKVTSEAYIFLILDTYHLDNVQDVPGVKVNISGFNSRVDGE